MVPSSVASCRLTLITEVATWLKLESTRGYGLGHGYGTIIVKNILVKVRETSWNRMGYKQCRQSQTPVSITWLGLENDNRHR